MMLGVGNESRDWKLSASGVCDGVRLGAAAVIGSR